LIIENILQIAPFEGWTNEALRQAASQAGIDAIQQKILFTGGINEVIALFNELENQKLSDYFAENSLENLRIPEKIEKIILFRLEQWHKNKEAIKKLINYNAIWNITASTSQFYSQVDLFWQLAGDNATDFNFYTKRMTLAAVYSSTMLFWLNDNSPDMIKTENFLKNRLNEVAKIGKFTNKIKKFF
jgi:ubiquinone biosynthesis protein COQ9